VLREEFLSTERKITPYSRPCSPPWFARNGHLQTLFAHLLPSGGRRVARITDAHREIELDDGERLLVFTRPGDSGVRVYLFHGLSGDVNADYMRHAADRLSACGHEVWSVNHRGCGEGEGLAGKPYHSGKVDDMQAVLAAGRDEAPHLLQLVIGFSLSGNIALLMAGRGAGPQPDGLIAINPPVDLHRASTDIHRGLSRLYETRFVLRLRRAVRARERAGLTSRAYSIPMSASLCDFDDLFTAPEAGFADGMDYYRRCSSLPHIASIALPTVWISAADDPFVAPDGFTDIARSESVHLHLEAHGGHVGYLARRGAGCERWLDGALEHYVSELQRVIALRRADS
jgi:predicted alpha/beta-fold hydrolase